MTNQELFKLALKDIPGGVNSPVRSFKSVNQTPFFTNKARDAYLFDIENKSYIDYVCSWGANIVGHANPYVVEAVKKSIETGLSYGTPTYGEVILAQKIKAFLPSIQKIRLVNSGTEATMSAIRLARGYTKRDYIIKFNGCYHGHSDSLLVKSGSGLLTFSTPSSEGVVADLAKYTLVAEYNDLDSVAQLFKHYSGQIAGIIVEPVAGNMNLIKPKAGFLAGLRELCNQHQSLLIFDEVMTGFRVALNSAQGLYNITPDLTTLGKIIGGGMPLAAFGGRAEIMDYLAPLGPVYQAGTLSGNPVAVSAGIINLELISAPDFYLELTKKMEYLISGINQIAQELNLPLCADSVGAMFGLYFNHKVPTNYLEMSNSNLKRFNHFFSQALNHGIFFAPSAFEAGFITSAHNYAILDKSLVVIRKILTNH